MADMAPMWPGSPDWPSSQRTHLLPMSAAHVLNNCNDKLATAKLGPNSIGRGAQRDGGGSGEVTAGAPAPRGAVAQQPQRGAHPGLRQEAEDQRQHAE